MPAEFGTDKGVQEFCQKWMYGVYGTGYPKGVNQTLSYFRDLMMGYLD